MLLILNYDIIIKITEIYFLDKYNSMFCIYDSFVSESIIGDYYSIISYDEINEEYIDLKECSFFHIENNRLSFSFKKIHYANNISFIRKLKIMKLL